MSLNKKILILILMACVGGGCNQKDNGSKCNPSMQGGNFKTITIEVLDARKIVDPGAYRFQLIPLVVFKSGEVIAPLVFVDYPRKGPMENIYYEKRQREALLGARAKIDVIMPSDGEVEKYVFLVRSLVEESGWRVVECDVMRNVESVITLPDINDVASLDQRPDRENLWGAYQKAKITVNNH